MESPAVPLSLARRAGAGEGASKKGLAIMSLDIALEFASANGDVWALGHDGRRERLHPLWLREHSREAVDYDPINHQRLYDPTDLPADLAVTSCRTLDAGAVHLGFSDGALCRLSLEEVATALGWRADPNVPPAPEAWTAATFSGDCRVAWAALDRAEGMLACLDSFFRFGFVILEGTPTEIGALNRIAGRFGTVRPTNFGVLFDVESKPDPEDLAYTGLALAAHTDNPYRKSVPGIQFLHCLANSLPGGDSTLVDGLAVAHRLAAEDPEGSAQLTQTPVEFVYRYGDTLFVHVSPLIELDRDGRIERIRFSTRMDYVSPLPFERLAVHYRARSRMARLLADPEFQIGFRMKPGDAIMMDNYRLLHGRGAFDSGAEGRRHLQGCYIEHDGPDGLYRVLAGKTKAAPLSFSATG